MMRWMVGASLRSRGLIVALGVGLLVLGVLHLEKMPRDVLPEINPPVVEVQTEALGLSAVEVEQLITVPLEQDLLNGVAFLDDIRSESVPGLSRIEMVFEPGTEIGRARQVVNERLTQAHALPNVSKPPQMLQPISSSGRVMMVGLTSKDKSLIDMSVLARWTIRPALLGVKGVSNVSIWGQREQQLQVQVDPARLQSVGVTLDQVMRTTGNALWVSPLTFLEASTPGTGGFFDTQAQRLGVQHVQPIKTPEDLAKVVIEQSPAPAAAGAEGEAPPPPAPPKRLGDVASVVQDHQPLIGDAVFTDGPGLLIVVEKFPEANALEVTEGVESVLHGLEPGLAGIDVNSSFFRPAEYLEQSTDNLRTALLIGLGLLAVALGVLFLRFRTAFITLIAILLSLAGAVLVLYARGETVNAMVLAGLVLALAVLVDDAVVGADTARRSQTASGDSAFSASRYCSAVLAVRGPLIFATVIALLVLIPVVALEGEMGAFLPPLALSYAGAVVVSMLIALTVTPALSMLLLAKAPLPPAEPPVEHKLRPRYEGALSRFTRTPRTAYLAGGLLLLLALLSLPLIDRGDSLVPTFKDRDLLVHWEGEPGTSLPEAQRTTALLGEELRALPGVNNVGGHVGRAILGDQIVGANSGELWVSLDASADYEGTVESIEKVVGGYPGIEGSVLTYPQDRIDDILLEPDGVEGKDLTVRVFGQDLDTLRAQADQVSTAVAEVDGVEAPVLKLPVLEPTVEVEVNLDKAQALGIKPGDVRRTAATVLSGIEVGNLFEEQKVFEVVVRGTPATRSSIDSVRGLLIDRPDGAGQVRLDQVADVRVSPNPNVIRHEDVSRYIDVGVDLSGSDVNAVARDIQDRLEAVPFPLEYHAELLTDYQEARSARWTFIVAALAAALGIFLLLQAAFGSWRLATILFVAIPLALTGGLVSTVITGGRLSLGSVAGFLAVLALAVRHSVLFVGEAQRREDQGNEAFGRELVRSVARARLLPVVISLLATAAMVLPLMFFDGPGLEIVQPMAVVLFGGVITVGIFSLLLLPALYLGFGTRTDADREAHLAVGDLITAEDDIRTGNGQGERIPVTTATTEGTRDA